MPSTRAAPSSRLQPSAIRTSRSRASAVHRDASHHARQSAQLVQPNQPGDAVLPERNAGNVQRDSHQAIAVVQRVQVQVPRGSIPAHIDPQLLQPRQRPAEEDRAVHVLVPQPVLRHADAQCPQCVQTLQRDPRGCAATGTDGVACAVQTQGPELLTLRQRPPHNERLAVGEPRAHQDEPQLGQLGQTRRENAPHQRAEDRGRVAQVDGTEHQDADCHHTPRNTDGVAGRAPPVRSSRHTDHPGPRQCRYRPPHSA